jgi:hypothetical protein
MSTIVTRAGKGSALTHAEVDANFTNLNTDKLETSTAASTYAPLASPALTGTPLAPTAAVNTNTTQLATTAFVLGQGNSTAGTIAMNGTQAAGSSNLYARADHVHPSDTTRAALAGATFTGAVTTAASATGGAGLNIPHGAAPTTPVNGDLWSTTTGLFLRTSGTTVQFATLTNTQTLSSKTLTTPILNGLNYGVTSQTSAYTATATVTVILCNSTTAGFTVTLPTAVSVIGRKYTIKKTDSSANAVTVGTTSSQTIDGSTTYSLPSQYNFVTVMSDGANWMRIG